MRTLRSSPKHCRRSDPSSLPSRPIKLTRPGLSVHMNQVHKENLTQVENALPNRQGLEVEIFGMEGIPQDILDQHRNRIIQNFYQAQEDRRIATGNPLPGQDMKNNRRKITVESASELKKRFGEFRKQNKNAAANGGAETVVQPPPASAPAYVSLRRAEFRVLVLT